MRLEKRKNYQLTGSIHTVSTKAKSVLREEMGLEKCIKTSTRVNSNGEVATTCRINPNKLWQDCFTYEECSNAVARIMQLCGADSYVYTRADFRLDSYNKDHYKEFAKLNKLLISLIAVTYKVRNCYKSSDLFSNNQLSIAIKNDYFEVENYDKYVQSNGTDKAMSRLELRSKRLDSTDLRTDFLVNWFERLDKASKHYQEVQDRYNTELVKQYDTSIYQSVNEFVKHKQDSIFCRKQLIDLLKRLGVNKVTQKADKLKDRADIEFFSQADIDFAISEIKRAMTEFFTKESEVL